MKETHLSKLVRQFNTAVGEINSLKEEYRPENSDDIDDIGKIAANIVLIYEILKSGHIDKMGYDVSGPIPRLKAYFLEQGVFDKDFCLVLVKINEPAVQYGYTRMKVLKFLRGEVRHGSTKADQNNSLNALKGYLYQENRDFKPAFAIRRDFLQFPNVITPSEDDSRSPFAESLGTGDGADHSLSTIESIVFSICNELGHISQAGTMGWSKACVAFEVSRCRTLLRHCIADNIIEQSTRWNHWNKFRIVGDG